MVEVTPRNQLLLQNNLEPTLEHTEHGAIFQKREEEEEHCLPSILPYPNTSHNFIVLRSLINIMGKTKNICTYVNVVCMVVIVYLRFRIWDWELRG